MTIQKTDGGSALTMTMEEILRRYHTVSIVGLSDKPERASNQIGQYLQEHGYTIIPINPACKEVLGETCYPDLSSVPQKVEIVDIFRRPEEVPPIVDEAIKIGAKVVWMQKGIINEEAAATAREAGLEVVMDHCMMEQHQIMTEKDTGP
jgi:predicted CoA-binding protein